MADEADGAYYVLLPAYCVHTYAALKVVLLPSIVYSTQYFYHSSYEALATHYALKLKADYDNDSQIASAQQQVVATVVPTTDVTAD